MRLAIPTPCKPFSPGEDSRPSGRFLANGTLIFTHELILRREPCGNDSNFIDAFDQDVNANREAPLQKGKLEMPVLAVYAALSSTGAGVQEMMCELGNRVFDLVLASPDAACWVAEANPRVFVDGLLSFLKATR